MLALNSHPPAETFIDVGYGFCTANITEEAVAREARPKHVNVTLKRLGEPRSVKALVRRGIRALVELSARLRSFALAGSERDFVTRGLAQRLARAVYLTGEVFANRLRSAQRTIVHRAHRRVVEQTRGAALQGRCCSRRVQRTAAWPATVVRARDTAGRRRPHGLLQKLP